MNRPRIKLIGGLWHCAMLNSRSRYCGIGYTPALAYRDWRQWKGGA